MVQQQPLHALIGATSGCAGVGSVSRGDAGTDNYSVGRSLSCWCIVYLSTLPTLLRYLPILRSR